MTTQSDKAGGKIFYGWILLAACFFLSVIGIGIFYCFGVFIKPFQDEFLVNRATVSSIYSVYGLVQLTAVFGGWASDRFGPRAVLAVCGPLTFAGFILSSRVDSFWQLYITYGIVLSLGGSAVFTTILSTTSRWFVKKRGLAMGILTSGIACGMMVMPFFTERFVSDYGWRTAMVILACASLTIFIIAAFLIRRNPAEMNLLPYGVTREKNNSIYQNAADIVTTQQQQNDPTLQQAIRTREIWLLFGMFATLGASVMMVNTHVIRYALDSGLSSARAALIVSIIGAGGIVGKLVGGALSDKVGSRRIIVICAAVLAIMMALLATPMTQWRFYAFAVPFGLAYGGWVPNITVLISDIFGTTHYGKIFAFANMGFAIGGSFSAPLLAGYIFDTTGSYHIAFLSGAGISVLAIVFTLLIKKNKILSSAQRS